MTVPTTDNRVAYVANGVTTVFAFTYRVVDKAHIQVYFNDVLQSTSLYTVKLDASGIGGTVTFTTAPANTVNVVILREADYLQNDHLNANESLPPATIERMVDKLAILTQQLSTRLLSCLRLAPSVDPASVNTILPTPGAGQILRWNLTANGLENVSPAQAFNDSVPAGGGGNVVGPVSSTDGSVVLWNGTNGQNIKNGIAPGASGNVLVSNGTAWGSQAPAQQVPTGVIALWSGSVASIPSGWTLCDGNNGTPNLQGLFVVGAGNSSPAATGGMGLMSPGGPYGDNSAGAGLGPSHTHVVSIINTSTPLGGVGIQTVNSTTTTSGTVTPKYYALCYIMKT